MKNCQSCNKLKAGICTLTNQLKAASIEVCNKWEILNKLGVRDMDKPCDTCTVNLEEAMLYDEVTCFKTCKDWKEWDEQRSKGGDK